MQISQRCQNSNTTNKNKINPCWIRHFFLKYIDCRIPYQPLRYRNAKERNLCCFRRFSEDYTLHFYSKCAIYCIKLPFSFQHYFSSSFVISLHVPCHFFEPIHSDTTLNEGTLWRCAKRRVFVKMPTEIWSHHASNFSFVQQMEVVQSCYARDLCGRYACL